MRRSTQVLAAIIFWFAIGPAQAEDWPRWRGPRGDGTWHGPATLATGTLGSDGELTFVWKTRINPGYSGVTVAGGMVYTMDKMASPSVEQIRCFDDATGIEVWKHPYSVDYGDLEYGSGPRASVTIHDGRAYAFGAIGHLHCLDAKTGEVLWHYDTVDALKAKPGTWGFSSSPFIYRDTVIVHLGIPENGSYAAFDLVTGDLRWRSIDDPAGYATPALIQVDGTEQLVCWTPTNIRGVSPATGEPLWQVPFEVKYGVSIATPIFHEHVVLVNEYWSGSKAIRLTHRDNRTEAEILWEKADLCGLMSQPLYRDGHVYLLEKSRGLCCFRLETGEILWEEEAHRLTPAERNPQATLVQLAGTDRALLLNARGVLVLLELNPSGYRELSRAQLVGKTWAHPAYAGSKVFARSDRELVCADLVSTDE